MKKKFKNKTCVVIPCYKVSNKILDVLNSKYLKIIDQYYCLYFELFHSFGMKQKIL